MGNVAYMNVKSAGLSGETLPEFDIHRMGSWRVDYSLLSQLRSYTIKCMSIILDELPFACVDRYQ